MGTGGKLTLITRRAKRAVKDAVGSQSSELRRVVEGKSGGGRGQRAFKHEHCA